MSSNIVIVIAHYNNPKGLKNSLKSIQEPFPVDIIVVDDGSKKKFSKKELEEVYTQGKIYFEYLPTNQGVGIAANLGLKKAQELNYKFTARFDCGDLFHPNKLQKQLTFLKENPSVKLLGTWVNYINEDGTFLHTLEHPTAHSVIKKKMYINSMFVNPTVVFYTEILSVVGDYPYKYRHASQDYAFFFKIVKKFEVANYPEVLLDYVVEENSISTKKRFLQVKNRLQIILDNFYFGFYPIYGLVRNTFLLFLTRNTANKIKRIFISSK